MILTLTLNPAIDATLTVDRIVYDDRTYITGEQQFAGGKGINAARVIHSYGGAVHAITPFGGACGERYVRLLRQSSLPVTLIPVRGETRRNFAITDRQGLTLKLDQLGNALTAEELDRLEQAVRRKLPQIEWLMLNGSIPPGSLPDFFARMIALAKQQGVKTLLDTSGEALPVSLAANPSIAKPNRAEAEKLLNRSLLSTQQAAEAIEAIRRKGAESVILSLGSQGALAGGSEGLLRAEPPRVESGCPIGAGDVLGAVCVWSLSRGDAFAEALRWGVAAATASAALPGLQFASWDDVQKMYENVSVEPM